ncbi:MAG: putative toxin-antitoxin system toxin component, PIN family [Candidatus Brocadiaceae bacterium]|nr:putative toxin-antitoxin system toxin component, PIN family [Candidatus Brocadiaceae bacterium]
MTQKIVLIDTNVWVSAFINRKGYPARVMGKFLNQEFDIVIPTPLLKELQDVLGRPRIKNLAKVTDDEIDIFVEILAGTGLIRLVGEFRRKSQRETL